MASRVFREVVLQMQEAINRTIGVVDDKGEVVCSSEFSHEGDIHPDVATELLENAEVFTRGGNTYAPFFTHQDACYAAYIEGADETAARFAALCAVSLKNILRFHDENFDKANFIKNVVMENILPGDIYAKAKELRFSSEAMRVVLLVRIVDDTDISAQEIISKLFPDKNKDFIFNVNDTDTVLVKEIARGIEEKDMEKLAASIIDTLLGEHYIRAVVGIGNSTVNVKELASSYKEAQIALEVRKVFDNELPIISYNHLGIARLVYQLPTTLCEMFIKEVFSFGSIDSLDEETLFTIQRFFENNLNVSETSRGLFVHRNTLVYRLEKIKKLTGLDLREFDDAIVFKVALMVKRYLSENVITKY
jgi:carbohydrate diacid regulator